MVLVKKWDFFHLFIYGKIGKKKVFGDILEKKNAFVYHKNKDAKKKSKNWPSQKGVSPCFW